MSHIVLGDALRGKSAIITGCANGIGKAAALAFSAAGARLTLADWADGEDVASAVRSVGGEAIFVRSDISSESDVEHLISMAVKTYGRLDCAFNNAGISGDVVHLADLPLADWEYMLRVNLTGSFLCVKHEIIAMRKTGGGAIVNSSSGLGMVAQAGSTAYCSAKAGVLALTRGAAVEYAADKIRVNAIMPGLVKTRMIEGAPQEILDYAASKHPIGRLAEPSEIADVAIFLCSDASSFVTGSAMAVDGGYMAV